jgi:hypothetical protein
MTMYELWKQTRIASRPVRLEDEGGPVLFLRPLEALAYARLEPDSWDAQFSVVEVRVGIA